MSVSVCLSVCPSVHLSVTFIRCGHPVQWISDIFACLDRWISLLLTNNASPGSSDGMMLGFLVEEGRGMEKLVIVAISLNLARLANLPEGLYILLALISSLFFLYLFFLLWAKLFQYLLDRFLFTKRKVFAWIFLIQSSFSNYSWDVAMTTNFVS